jgi:hypothetical protein
MTTTTFEQWINSEYQSPIDFLVQDLVKLSAMAAQCNALITEQVLRSIKHEHFSGSSKRIYLPNLRNHKDSKQYLIIKMGVTGDKVPIPILLIRSYRTSFADQVAYSPAQYLWSQYRRFKKNDKTISPQNGAYLSALEQSRKQAKQLEEHEEEQRKAAFSASQVGLRRLFNHSQEVSKTAAYLSQCNIDSSLNDGVRVCHSTVTANLYYTTRDIWQNRPIAYPRDLIIPMFDESGGNIVNAQIISASNTTFKRFIPGAPRNGLALFLPNNKPTQINIIFEGYRTAKAAEYLHKLSGIDIPCRFIVAFAANNIPEVVQRLSINQPGAVSLSAYDYDAIASTYAEQSTALGSVLMPPPSFCYNADWADATKNLALNEAIDLWATHFTIALDQTHLRK